MAQLSQTPHGEVIYIRCYPGRINAQKPKTDPPELDRTHHWGSHGGGAKPLVSESGVQDMFHVFFTEDVSKQFCVLSKRCWRHHVIVHRDFTDVKMAGWETIRLLLTRKREGPPAVTATQQTDRDSEVMEAHLSPVTWQDNRKSAFLKMWREDVFTSWISLPGLYFLVLVSLASLVFWGFSLELFFSVIFPLNHVSQLSFVASTFCLYNYLL